MTIGEIHASIQLKIDKVGSYSTANLISGEIDDFINDAIRDYVNQQKVLLRDYRNVRSSSEAQENLRPLIARESISNSISSNTVIDADGFEFNLSNLPQYEYFISGKADFDGEWNLLKPVSTAYLTDENQNQYNSPFLNGIPVAIEGNILIGVHPDSDATPSEAVINYLQKPDKVDKAAGNNTDLPDHTHRDIVDIASRKIIQSLSGQGPNQQQQGEG